MRAGSALASKNRLTLSVEEKLKMIESNIWEVVRPSIDLTELVASLCRALAELVRIPSRNDAGLGLSGFTVLIALSGDGRLTNVKLFKGIGVSAQRANQVVSELVKNGLVEIVADVHDLRQRRIQLTSSGRARILRVLQELDAFVLSGAEDRSMTPLARAIARLIRSKTARTCRLAA